MHHVQHCKCFMSYILTLFHICTTDMYFRHDQKSSSTEDNEIWLHLSGLQYTLTSNDKLTEKASYALTPFFFPHTVICNSFFFPPRRILHQSSVQTSCNRPERSKSIFKFVLPLTNAVSSTRAERKNRNPSDVANNFCITLITFIKLMVYCSYDFMKEAKVSLLSWTYLLVKRKEIPFFSPWFSFSCVHS